MCKTIKGYMLLNVLALLVMFDSILTLLSLDAKE